MEVVYFVLSFFAISVNSIAIRGPMLTRYNPCSLGVLYFDKLTNTSWQGTINYRLYPNITDANIEITFDKPIRIFRASNNSTIYTRNNRHSFLFKPRGVPPRHYFFYIAVIDEVSNVPNVVSVKLNNYTLCNPAVKNELNIQSYNVTQPDDKSYHHVCGRRALHNAELSSMRTDAKAGDWPWHVVVLMRENILITTRYQCGGNIISRTAVLTAAHCVINNSLPLPSSLIIIGAGVENLKLLNQSGVQLHNAVNVIVNPGYKSEVATADLAIIRVNAFRYTDYVQPICLWGPSYDKSDLYGRIAVVVGFGTTEENQLSDTLRSTDTMVQNDTTCISSQPQFYTSLLNEFTFCAGLDPNPGTISRGDSGGGLTVAIVQPDHKVSWFLRGVISSCAAFIGETRCNPNFYSIYNDVGPHYGWIYHNAGLNYFSNIVY
ncbi:serine protease 41-like [Pieris rapae]|uniref:serine protease 41-like n=1 Tax=Pieris rapae TaxID=64459 RepID=UPI001E280DBA|nr:serine protease 41-like [Pieris rapae]